MAEQMLIKPDLQTRESVMAAAGRVQFAVTDLFRKAAGQPATQYVRLDCKRKNPEGSDKRYEQVPLAEATHVFISEKGYGTERLGTYYPPKPGSSYKTGRLFTEFAMDTPPMKALVEVVNIINGGVPPMANAYEIVAEDRCGLCGRELTDPVSVKRGIGPECAGKATGTKILHASAFAQMQLPARIEIQRPEFTDEELRVLHHALGVDICETDGTPLHHELDERIKAYLALVQAPVAV